MSAKPSQGTCWRLVCETTALLGLATTLLAQTPPAAEEESTLAETLESEAQSQRWDYALGTGLTWDSNIDFVTPAGPKGIVVAPRGSLARLFAIPHAQLRATAAASAIGSSSGSAPGRYDGNLGFDASYRPSPSTRWRASGSYGLGYTDSSRSLLEQGVVLPVVKARVLTGSLGLTRSTGSRTSLRVDARFQHADFDPPSLVGADSARSAVGLERRLSDRSTTALEYALESVRMDQGRGSYLTHRGSFQWAYLVSPRSTLLLDAGSTYTRDAARAALDDRQNLFGGASFTRRAKRSSLTLLVRRDVTPVLGLGASLRELRLGLGATVAAERAWELRIAVSYVRPDMLRAAQALSAASDDVFAALDRRLGSRLDVSGELRYRRRAASQIPGVETFRAGLYVTLIPPPSQRATLP
jgi:hypothetical protein